LIRTDANCNFNQLVLYFSSPTTSPSDPHGDRAILVVVRAIQKRRQSSLKRRCRVHCNRDHLIANNVMQQTGSFSVPGKRKLYSENLWAQVIRPIGREGVVELHTAGEV